MEFHPLLSLIFILSLCPFLTASQNPNNPSKDEELQTYIVHVEPDSAQADFETRYASFLPKRTVASKSLQPRILHNYQHAFSGFAAKLSREDVEVMKQKAGFISAQPERIFSLLTTHSPEFFGLHRGFGFWNTSNYGKGVIVALLDSGVAPGHPSFNDEGVPPPPRRWKGKCEFPTGTCNKKLIGARSFVNTPPNDTLGHGSHTAGTAVGNFVPAANVHGSANGTAAGIAPLAHLAVYKVCNGDDCAESSILAGIDAAIADQVDIISMSLGSDPKPYYTDSIAIGLYKAMEKGIFASCAGGNSGPNLATVTNSAPWILTVGASTFDRVLGAEITLGNNTKLLVESAFQDNTTLPKKEWELFFPQFSCAELDSNTTDELSGKVAVCVGSGYGGNVKKYGGAAMIETESSNYGTPIVDTDALPSFFLNLDESVMVNAYKQSTPKPVANFTFKGTMLGAKNAPVLAWFSSRGPSRISPGILKPDIIGPGVNILAAWPTSLDDSPTPSSKVTFNLLSGTSMATPHLAGIAALLKSAHPDWSPAAIRSAIVTTATQLNLAGEPIKDHDSTLANIYTLGSGYPNPSNATDPGLIYDLTADDYIPYLCGGLNYTSEQVGKIVQRKVDCGKEASVAETGLNYPSISLVFGVANQNYTRTVTNVGPADSAYDAKVSPPEGVAVKVEPEKLKFSRVNEKLEYRVIFMRNGTKPLTGISQGSITWVSDRHVVRTNIAVAFDLV